MGPVRKQSPRRGTAAAGMVMIAALALAGCAGDPEEPAATASPTGGSTSAPPASDAPSEGDDGFPGDWEEPALWWIVEKYDDEFVLAGTGNSDQDGVSTSRSDQQVPLDTSELEVHVYCTPVGATGVLQANSQRAAIECPGTEDPQIVRVSAEGLETSTDMSWQLTLDETDEDWQQAVVFLPADS